MNEYEVVYFQGPGGPAPFQKWFDRLDGVAARKVYKALIRMEAGIFSDSKLLKNGIWERRIHSGPGYRLYYGLDGSQTIVMLAGGTKRSQQRDINQAQKNWHEYQTRTY